MPEYVEGIPLLRPLIDLDNKGFWEGIDQHELRIQRCKTCGSVFHPARPMCPECRTLDNLEWVACNGKGTIWSYITFMTPAMAYPAFKVPYTVILVEMEEGIRFVSLFHGEEPAPDELYYGMPVEVVFDKLDGKTTLFLFKKRES